MEVWNPIWNRLETILSDTDNLTVGIDEGVQEFFRRLVDQPPPGEFEGKSADALSRAWYVLKTFPKLGERYVLYPICNAVETNRSQRSSKNKEILEWEVANASELLMYKRGLIEDSNTSLQNRIAMLELFTPEELSTVETKAIFAQMTSNMLSQAAKSPDLLFAELRSYGRVSNREGRIANGTSAKPTKFSQLNSFKAFASLLYATERLPSSIRPDEGLDSVIQATKETHDHVQSELMKQLGVDSLFPLSFENGGSQGMTAIVRNKRIILSEDLEKLIDVYFCHRWANELRGTPTAD